ncbi:MAG TPA: hypothetical protein VFI23_02865 [Rhizomicrobium sp.]|nr:hypothetical protein [Rhizomicrobium sp.]
MSETKASQRRDAANRTAQGVSEVWEKRTQQVKRELAAESAANDAKTARLRALRLAKEAEDAEAAKNAPPPPPAKKRKSKP